MKEVVIDMTFISDAPHFSISSTATFDNEDVALSRQLDSPEAK